MFQNAKWIWCQDNDRKNDWVLFRKEFSAAALPAEALMHLAVDTKYWMYVNGQCVVFEGGLFRESAPGCGYYDTVDIAPYLRQGENILAFRCTYYGNGGRNNIDSGRAGILFECASLGLYSDQVVSCLRDPAVDAAGSPPPSYLYGGHHLRYRADLAMEDWMNLGAAARERFQHAVEYGSYPCAPWNTCEERPIPLMRFGHREGAEFFQATGGYEAPLPYAMHLTPWLKVEAAGGEVIQIYTDRYEIHGGPGDEQNTYFAHRVEYVCREGVQTFESFEWIFGEKLMIKAPDTVRALEIGYRESEYPSDVILKYQCRDESLQILLDKCIRTLKVCMRENFMDCPDRERGQWIGDVSVQAPQVFDALDQQGAALLRKAIVDFLRLRKGDRLVGNVPGENFAELPAQSLQAISELGMIAVYYDHTKEEELLREAFEPCVRYLKLWELDEQGFLISRSGDWSWYDHLYNIDGIVIEHAWYYSALKFAKRMGGILNRHQEDLFLKDRMEMMECRSRDFYRDGIYASGAVIDERANALMVLSGLAPKESYPAISKVLTSVQNCTPYMEYYVLEALCQMGYRQEAYHRMMERYRPLIENKNTTLWEDFHILGTKNHAWSGGPLSIVCKYFRDLL